MTHAPATRTRNEPGTTIDPTRPHSAAGVEPGTDDALNPAPGTATHQPDNARPSTRGQRPAPRHTTHDGARYLAGAVEVACSAC